MTVSQIKTDNSTTAKYGVTIPASDVTTAITEKLIAYGKNATIPGFRKGKTPISILQKRYGDAALNDYINSTVQTTVENTAKENDLKLALQPHVEVKSASIGEKLEFEITYTLLPEIDLMDVSTLKLTTIKAKVDDSQIDAYLEQMAKQSRESEPVDRKAKKGDMVVLDFDGSIDGATFKGGSASDHNLELGSDQFIPGFEEQLIGTKAGDSKTVTVSFPKEYQEKDLAGKQAVFDCTIKQVKKFKDAVIDDALATKFGLKNLQALRDAVTEQFANQYAGQTRPLVKKEIMDAFDTAHKFDVPQAMLDQEFKDMWEQVQIAKENGQLDPEDADKDDDQLKSEYLQLANRRVRLGLVLTHIASEWKIEVSQDDVNQAVMQEAQRYPGQEAQIFEYYQKNPQVAEQLRAPILEEKVVDAILKKADITEKELTGAEIEALANAEEENSTAPKKAKKSSAKKSSAKKASAKKASTKKSSAKKASAKKATAKKASAKKATAKKSTAKKA